MRYLLWLLVNAPGSQRVGFIVKPYLKSWNLVRQVEEFSLSDMSQSDIQTEPTDGYG